MKTPTPINLSLLKTVAILFLIPLVMSSCQKEQSDPTIDDEIAALGLDPLPAVAHPADNAPSSAKIALGRLLFWDPIVSGHKDVACATCHHPDFAYTDGLDLPVGVNGTGLGPNRTENTGGLVLESPIERVPRNSPTVLNAAYNGMTTTGSYSPEFAPMFWDARMLSFESQCQGPPNSRSEMRGDAYDPDPSMDTLVARLSAIPQYVSWFNNAFSEGAASVTRVNFTKALSAFERTIVTDDSPYDRYLRGNRSALTDNQKKGLLLFFGKAKCDNCHSGPMLSDFNFHALGIPDNPDHPAGTDKGKDNMYRFRTPSLRNVELTAPYMHNGMIKSLREVVEYVNEAQSQNVHVLSGMMDHELKPLGLTGDEMDAIVDFLKSLTDRNFDRTIPSEVPSGLPVGGNIN